MKETWTHLIVCTKCYYLFTFGKIIVYISLLKFEFAAPHYTVFASMNSSFSVSLN